MFNRRLTPQLEDHESTNTMGHKIRYTDNGVAILATVGERVDLESNSFQQRLELLQVALRELPENQTLRVILRRNQENTPFGRGIRSEGISEIGWIAETLYVGVEDGSIQSLNPFSKSMGKKKARNLEIPESLVSALGLRSLDREVLRSEYFYRAKNIKVAPKYIDRGEDLVGVVRIHKPGLNALDATSVYRALSGIPLPFEVSVTLRKTPKVSADVGLRLKIERSNLLNDVTSIDRKNANEETLRKLSLENGSMFEIEWLLVLKRSSEESLRLDLGRAKSSLAQMADVTIETFGALNSYRACFPAEKQHLTFKELSDSVAYYLPCFTFGEGGRVESPRDRTLALHRCDGSIKEFDLFSDKYLAYNALVIGKTGSGKSVLTSLITRSLLKDENVNLIKIDVGGSYRKECIEFQGKEYTFSLDKPLGINPLKFISRITEKNAALETLKQFVSSLIREEDEQYLSKGIQGEIERELQRYLSEDCERSKSIDDLLLKCPSFPRRDLLSRWGKDGIFGNALLDREHEENPNRYRYFNFENIVGAANKEYASGVMASVIAAVNLEMILSGDRLSNPNGKRLVLICDETRFFIDKNAEFFLLTTANFRKFGHGVILINQNIKNLEIRAANGELDRGLFINSPIRFLLQADYDESYLLNTLNLHPYHVDILTKHAHRGSEFREVVLQDDEGTRVLRVYLTEHEYWSTTSSNKDNQKIRELMDAVPGLSLKEAVKCLASVG